ncbi:PrgI family protein [Patescibacteria group bacterium]|nr:PrgI family protein [Patescibacteria group bacterium]
MHFQTPQFIEVEDKIFGPLTLRQFLYLIGGGATIFLLYTFLPFFLFVIFVIPVGALSAALSFYKMNGQPFVKTIEKALRYSTGPKIYVWKKTERHIKKTSQENIEKEPIQSNIPKLTQGRLNDLAWSLDTKGKRTTNKR